MSLDKSSFERATALLRTVMIDRPGILRADLVARITTEAICHESTVTRAIEQANDLGFVQKIPYKRTVKYRWNDNPVPRDTAPRVVRVVPADKAPRVTGERLCDGIAWGLQHCLRAYA